MATQIHALTAETQNLRRQIEQAQVTIQQLTLENHQLRDAAARAAATAPATPSSPGSSSAASVNPGYQAIAAHHRPPDQTARAGSAPSNHPAQSATSPTKPAALTHTVRKGDTATSIARRYGITVRDLVRLNPSLDPARIRVGEVLRVRSS
ncbi:MAG: LysM peptidoglycan-binding domain-containing protein [Verrucomicrobia bacterium]|nr:LysM peptidoglycan-binding domain-containing protein [Verrucomicrobiota bacterium]